MRIAILLALASFLAWPALAQGFASAMAQGAEERYNRNSRERIAKQDRQSRERMTYIIGGAIVVAGVAIGIGVARRAKT